MDLTLAVIENGVFTQRLLASLRSKFPGREFIAKTFDPQKYHDLAGQATVSEVYEVVKRVFGVAKKRQVASLWAGYLPCSKRNAIDIYDTNLREYVTEESRRLNRLAREKKTILQR